MVDAAYSRKLQLGRTAVGARWQLIIPLVAAFVLIGGGGWTVWAFSATKEDAPRASDVLLETTKGLEVTQQQAVDQLQIVQDQLAAQQAETKKLSKQIATLTEKLDALQQSVANIPALSVATPAITTEGPAFEEIARLRQTFKAARTWRTVETGATVTAEFWL